MGVTLSKLSVKSQTVIPREVREKLGLKPGDRICYRMDGKRVVIERFETGEEDDPFTTFDEWASPEDDAAYGSL